MEIIKINKEDLEYIRTKSENSKTEFPYPIYIEYDKGSIVVIINCGKYINYITHVDVLFPENIAMQKLIIVVKFNRLDINAKNIKNANVSSSIDKNNIINTTGNSTYPKKLLLNDFYVEGD